MSVDVGIPAWAGRPQSERRDPDTQHGLPCPHCAGDSRVIDTRYRKSAIRRRRVCFDCKRRFTTYEIATDIEPSRAAEALRKQAAELRLMASRLDAMAASGGDEC